MPQKNREEPGVLSKPIRDIYQAIKQLQSVFTGGAITVSGAVTVQEPLSVDDNAGSLTVDAPAATPVAVAVTDTSNTLVKAGDAANNAIRVNIIAGAGSGGTASTDDAAFTAAAGSGTPMMGFVTADSVDSGDVGVVGMLANRQLKVTLYDSGGSEVAVAGGTQYTEDAAAAANPVGQAQICVRKDTPADEVSTDGDNIARRSTKYGAAYTQIVNSSGAFVDTFGGGTQYTEGDTDASITGTAALWEDGSDTLRAVSMAKPLPVQPGTSAAFPVTDNSGSLTVDNAALSVVGGGAEATALRVTVANDSTGVLSVDDNGGSLTVDAASLPLPTGASTLAEQQTQTTALQLIDDVVHASDAALGKVAAIGAQHDDTAPGTTTENNVRPLRMSTRRELYIQIRDASGNERGVDVTADGRAEVSATIDAALPAGTNNIGDVDVLTLPTTEQVCNGAHTSDFSPVDATTLTSTTNWTEILAAPSNPWRFLRFANTSDRDIRVSFNGTNASSTGNIHLVVGPGEALAYDLYANGLKESSNVCIRNDGTTPSRGKFYYFGAST